MKTICAIRTNKWDANAERLYQQLLPAFGDDLVVVFHNRPRDVTPPLPCVDISRPWVRRKRLGRPTDWGWRCGDYFYFCLRDAYPDYDQYWLVEPDVFFRGDARSFFGAFEDSHQDMLTYRMKEMGRNQVRFAREMPNMAIQRAIFALTRFSGRALDFLLAERQAFSANAVANRLYPNDEIFSMSHVCANPDLSDGDMEAIAPEWFASSYFNTAPDILVDTLLKDPEAPNGVFHPVHEKEAFKNAMVSRITGSTRFVSRMASSIACLDETDVQDVVAAVSVVQERRLMAMLKADATPVQDESSSDE